MSTLTLIPAYGRDYKSKAAAVADWNANKDFEIATPGHHRYINKADATFPVVIRYNKLTRLVRVTPETLS